MTDSSAAAPTVVLVHGAWGDGSSWQRVIPILLDTGIAVVAVQNPTSSLADDVAATNVTLNAIPGPVVLVGHSWGGAVITQAGNNPKVKALVYVAAFAPAAGESVGALVARFPSPPALSKITDDGAGNLKLSLDAWINDVGHGLPESEARLLHVLQPPLPATTFDETITQAAWQGRPSWYIVSADDRAVSVELERAAALRMAANTVELVAGHMSLLSHPEAVAAVIIEAVKQSGG